MKKAAPKAKAAPKKKYAAKRPYDAKLDESLGMRRGKEASKKQSMLSRRKESRGMKKAMSKKGC